MKNKIFIIAEAGVNHNGKKDFAFKMVDAACNTKVDAIKFQTFKAELLASKIAQKAKYQIKARRENESQFDMLEKLQFPFEVFKELKKYCDKKGILFLSTPFDNESVDFLENLVPLYKIGSGDLNNLPFLKYVAKKNKPIFLSTGMSTVEEIKNAVKTIESNQRCSNNTRFPPLTLLHCTTSYPCPYKDVNLFAINTLRNTFGLPVGFSDHTTGIEISIAAVSFGVKVIEKHFTLDKDLNGPDHKMSLDPEELKMMVAAIRNAEVSLGKEFKEPQESEIENINIVRKSLVVSRNLNAGEKITPDVVSIKRPGYGISPVEFDKVIGRKLKRNKLRDELLTWEDFK